MKKKKKTSWRTSRDAHSVLVRAMSRYLKKNGWVVIMSGVTQVRESPNPETRSMMFEFVMPFLGHKKEEHGH